MMYSFRLAFAFVASTLCSSPTAAQDCADGKCIRIGSYNIRYFASTGPAKTANDIETLSKRIADEAKLDVVVLQEINIGGANWAGPGGLKALLAASGFAEAIAGKFGGKPPEGVQHVVLMYRTNTVSMIAASANELPIPTTHNDGPSCFYESLRPPVYARFKAVNGSFAFRMIGVHLKSQRPVDGDPTKDKTCDDTIRAAQAKAIAAEIAKLKAAGETNVIVAGDFNAEFKAPEYAALRDAGLESLIKGDCSKTNISQCSYIYYDEPDLIDHIVVPSSMMQAVNGSGTIMQVGDLGDYWKKQSDHVPVWASFRKD